MVCLFLGYSAGDIFFTDGLLRPVSLGSLMFIVSTGR